LKENRQDRKDVIAKVHFTLLPHSPARADEKSPLERGAGVCTPPLAGGVGEGHLILLQEPQQMKEFELEVVENA
jgi:hypothetical protein